MVAEHGFPEPGSKPLPNGLPLLAVSAKWHQFPNQFEWLLAHGFAMEYTPNRKDLSLLLDHTRPYLERGVSVRHHGFVPGFEIGNANGRKAEIAMQLHFRILDAIQGIGEQVITFHVGLTRLAKIDSERVKDNLGRLVEYAGTRGITINLENLKNGIASNPETIKEWADASGSMITLDIGHAVSCEWRRVNCVSVPEIIDLFEDRLNEVHLYEQETDRHLAPENMDILGPIIDRLMMTKCHWWTIELEDRDEILNTRRLVSKYVEARKN